MGKPSLLDERAVKLIHNNEVLPFLRALVKNGYNVARLGNDVQVIAVEFFERKREIDPKYPYGFLK